LGGVSRMRGWRYAGVERGYADASLEVCWVGQMWKLEICGDGRGWLDAGVGKV